MKPVGNLNHSTGGKKHDQVTCDRDGLALARDTVTVTQVVVSITVQWFLHWAVGQRKKPNFKRKVPNLRNRGNRGTVVAICAAMLPTVNRLHGSRKPD